MSPEELAEVLSTLGIAHEVRPSGADGALLVIPEYGRVLGLWPHLKSENALWVNPEFLRSLQLGLKDDGWNNPGGDWIWLAPAEEFLVEGRAVPSIDPGKYALASDRLSLSLTNRGDALAQRAGAGIRFRLSRRIRPLFEPEIDTACGPTWLRRAGWDEQIELEVQGRIPVAVQAWSLTQAPPGSEMLAGHRRLVCIEDADSDRARLLVKTASAGSASAGPAFAGSASAASAFAGPLGLSFISPPIRAGRPPSSSVAHEHVVLLRAKRGGSAIRLPHAIF